MRVMFLLHARDQATLASALRYAEQELGNAGVLLEIAHLHDTDGPSDDSSAVALIDVESLGQVRHWQRRIQTHGPDPRKLHVRSFRLRDLPRRCRLPNGAVPPGYRH